MLLKLKSVHYFFQSLPRINSEQQIQEAVNKPNKLIINLPLIRQIPMSQTVALKLSQTIQCSQVEQEGLLNMSIDNHKKVLQDKNNQMNKTIIPIKQYSNKFLRSSTIFKQRPQPPNRKINTQQRFNVILKKKNALTKNLPKENWHRFEYNSVETTHQNQALIKVSRLYQSRRENVKTEASNNIDNNFSHVQMLDSSLFNLIAPSSNLLNSSAKSRFFDDSHKQIEEKKSKSISNKSKEKKEKISQSRGLEMFSKIFVRSKDEIFEKIQKKTSNQKYLVPKFYQNQQNFQTHKITPIQKDKKARILIETFRPKKRTLVKKCHTNENRDDSDDFFQLNGWQTTI